VYQSCDVQFDETNGSKEIPELDVGNGHVREALKKLRVGDVLPREEDNDPSTLPQHQIHKIVHHLHQAPQKKLQANDASPRKTTTGSYMN
jgi:hypothetical protein